MDVAIIKPVMYSIVAKNVFVSKSGALIAKDSAYVTVKTKTEYANVK